MESSEKSSLNIATNSTMPTYFQTFSLSNNSSNQLNGLASDLSDLAIGDRPPPRKIRRRNALTVQDPHYPLMVPPPNSPVHDAFEDSSRLQALDEIVHRDFTFEDDSSNSSATSAEPKRKLAASRRFKAGPRIPGEEKEVRQILLHKDLEQFKPQASLPEFLLKKYVKSVKSSLSSPCNALVPYQPPEKMLNEILNKETTAGNGSIEPQNLPGSKPGDVMETDD